MDSCSTWEEPGTQGQPQPVSSRSAWVIETLHTERDDGAGAPVSERASTRVPPKGVKEAAGIWAGHIFVCVLACTSLYLCVHVPVPVQRRCTRLCTGVSERMLGSEESLRCLFPPSILRQVGSYPQCRYQAHWPLNLWGFSCLCHPVGVLELWMCVIASGFMWALESWTRALMLVSPVQGTLCSFQLQLEAMKELSTGN